MTPRRENLYSRFVAAAKIALPLMALAILSSLFLFSKSRDPAAGVQLLDSDLMDYAQKERITAPRFAGLTPSGVAIQIAAREASPRPTGGPSFDAFDLLARVEAPDGGVINVTAATGSIDSLAMMSELSGGIVLDTSYGFVAETHGMTFALDRLDIRSQGRITARGPLGQLEAGEMHVYLRDTGDDDTTAGYVLDFKRGVKLVYKP
ncbi:MAG: hypothetical protein K8F59_14645 [Rhodobacteraceae bacterium]|nr:hypothetical protein [Paracoccaceae bacterium]